MADNWIHGPPDLVIEILSPSTASRDLKLPLRLYERQGVPEEGSLYPEEDAVAVWRFGADPEYERFTERLPVRVGDETVGDIDLSEVFRRD